jgi:hypothetical protein
MILMSETIIPVLLHSKDKKWKIGVDAKVDTGATRSSIHDELAATLGLKPHRYAIFKNANGKQRRGVAKLRISINGEQHEIEVSITNRQGLRYPMILGHRDQELYIHVLHTM